MDYGSIHSHYVFRKCLLVHSWRLTFKLSSKLQRFDLRYIGFFLLTAGLVMTIPMTATGQGTLTLTINRNAGLSFGNFIQGSFTLSGSGSESVQNLTVYFNGEKVHFVIGNTITWEFSTGDYPSGSTNITLFGVDDVGGTYSAYSQVTFMGSETVATIVTVIVALIAVMALVKYRGRLHRSGNK